MKPLPQDVSTQNTAKESNKQSESTRGLEKFVKKVVRYHTKNPDIESCYNSEDRSVPETISIDEITDSRNYISIGALGKPYGIGDSFLFEYFTILGWVARINNKRRLTKIGLHKGGRYKTLNDEDFWIVFNKNLLLDPQIFIKEYEKSGYQRSDLNIEEEDALMPNHTSLSLNEKFPTPSVEKTKPCIKKTNQMEFAEIIEILTSLANCINLNNVQCLENSSPYHSDRIVKALCTAIRYLEKHSESEFNLIEEEKLTNKNKKNGGKKKLQVPDLDDKKQRIKEQSDILHPVPDNHDICRRHYKGEKPIKIMQDLKYDYPEYLIFVQNGFFWEVYEDDAQICSQIFGWRVASHSSSANFTGVPVNAKKFKERLEEEGKSYILVAQTQFPSESGCIERVPIELFSAHEFKQE